MCRSQIDRRSIEAENNETGNRLLKAGKNAEPGLLLLVALLKRVAQVR